MESYYENVDISFLQNLTGGSAGTTLEILNLFKTEVPKYLADLRKGIEEKNLENIAYVAHKAKSSFALMGIIAVVTILKNLEIDAKSATNVEKFSSMVFSVEDIYNKAIVELERYVAGLTVE